LFQFQSTVNYPHFVCNRSGRVIGNRLHQAIDGFLQLRIDAFLFLAHCQSCRGLVAVPAAVAAGSPGGNFCGNKVGFFS